MRRNVFGNFCLDFLNFHNFKTIENLIPKVNFYVRNHENVKSKLFKLILN
jgi:hypothetical protein